jgi:ANTAR domain
MTEERVSAEPGADSPTALEVALDEVEGLRRALETRTTIGQAVGIVMNQRSLTAEEAFTHLVELSSHSNTKLRDVAASIVTQAEGRTTRDRTAPRRLAMLDDSGHASAAVVVDLYATGDHLDRPRASDQSS